LILVLRIGLFELKDVAAWKEEIDEESCVEGTEECLKRRTLAAHLDYIYTQKGKEGHHS